MYQIKCKNTKTTRHGQIFFSSPTPLSSRQGWFVTPNSHPSPPASTSFPHPAKPPPKRHKTARKRPKITHSKHVVNTLNKNKAHNTLIVNTQRIPTPYQRRTIALPTPYQLLPQWEMTGLWQGEGRVHVAAGRQREVDNQRLHPEQGARIFQKKKRGTAKNNFQPFSVHISLFFQFTKHLRHPPEKSVFDFQTFRTSICFSNACKRN